VPGRNRRLPLHWGYSSICHLLVRQRHTRFSESCDTLKIEKNRLEMEMKPPEYSHVTCQCSHGGAQHILSPSSHPLVDDSTRHRRHLRSAFGRLITRSPVRSQVTQGADYFHSFFCRFTASVLSTFRLPYPNTLLSLPLVSIPPSLSHCYSISIIEVTVSPKGLRTDIARPR
jgi:hypothetical protein